MIGTSQIIVGSVLAIRQINSIHVHLQALPPLRFAGHHGICPSYQNVLKLVRQI